MCIDVYCILTIFHTSLLNLCNSSSSSSSYSSELVAIVLWLLFQSLSEDGVWSCGKITPSCWEKSSWFIPHNCSPITVWLTSGGGGRSNWLLVLVCTAAVPPSLCEGIFVSLSLDFDVLFLTGALCLLDNDDLVICVSSLLLFLGALTPPVEGSFLRCVGGCLKPAGTGFSKWTIRIFIFTSHMYTCMYKGIYMYMYTLVPKKNIAIDKISKLIHDLYYYKRNTLLW